MAEREHKTETDATQNSKAPVEKHAGAHEEDCRCKETSRMSPAELLKLMMNDLAFWKKDGKK